MSGTLLLQKAAAVTPEGVRCLDILVRGGKIAALLPAGSVRHTDVYQTVSCEGYLAFPGGIDVHVHVEDLGAEDIEDWPHATFAAAMGGITLLVDMPIDNIPSTVDGQTIRMKLLRAEGRSYTDYMLWGGLCATNAGVLPEMLREGIAGFKCFLTECGIPDYPMVTDEALRDGMRTAAEYGVPVMVHAEDDALIRQETARRADSRAWADWTYMHPPRAEAMAIRKAASFAAENGCAVHIAHVSSREAVDAVRCARAAGVRMTAETCFHYLYFTEEDYARKGAAMKCAPPIRTAGDREALWEGLMDGTIGIVSSDHSPKPPEMKTSPVIAENWSGIAGLEGALPILYDLACVRRGIAPERVADWISQNPARLLGLSRQKGAIRVGWDADLVLFDPEGMTAVGAESRRTLQKESAWNGEVFRGRVVCTFLRGEAVTQKGMDGRYIRRVEAAV